MKSTKLSDLVKHKDGVWARRSVNEIDGFEPSRFYAPVKASQDSPVFSNELIELAEDFEDLLQLSPLRANLLRAFDWNPQSRVLEIGCGAGLITTFLSGLNLQVDAIEPDRALAQLAAVRTQGTESARVIAEPFAMLDFESNRYDVIIVCGDAALLNCMADHQGLAFEQVAAEVLTTCKALLNDQGQLMLAVDNRYGVNYLFAVANQFRNNVYTNFNIRDIEDFDHSINLNKWLELLSGSFKQVKEYYLFPDIYYSRVLLGRDFVQAHSNAYQHIDSMHSISHFQSSVMTINESMLYQVANKNGYIGEVANGYLFTMTDNSEPQPGHLDFAHFPDFNRRPEYLSVVLKKTRENEIKRLSVVDSHDSCVTNIKQTIEPETYYAGIQLSVLWRNSFLMDPRGVKFEQYLLVYFSFLKKLDAGVLPGMNIDAIANNIIVDSDGEYHLIDHEWQGAYENIKSDFVFYRAMVHFAHRNTSIFQDYKWINGLASLGDFLIYCFKTIGIDLNAGELETFRERDCLFLSEVMLESAGYQLYDPFGVDVQIPCALTYINWRYYDGHYHPHQKAMCTARVGNESQMLSFTLPCNDQQGVDKISVDRQVESFRFFPFEHLKAAGANYFGIDSLRARIIDAHGIQHDLLNLGSGDEVHQANIHKGIFFAEKENQHVFMFNNNDTFLEFKLPHYDPDIAGTIQIVIEFRLVPSHDYEMARYQFGLAERQVETLSQIKDHEIDLLKDALEEITQKNDELKNSRVWRLLMAYRDSFKIGGYPRKNLLEKLAHMIRLFKYPRKTDDD